MFLKPRFYRKNNYRNTGKNLHSVTSFGYIVNYLIVIVTITQFFFSVMHQSTYPRLSTHELVILDVNPGDYYTFKWGEDWERNISFVYINTCRWRRGAAQAGKHEACLMLRSSWQGQRFDCSLENKIAPCYTCSPLAILRVPFSLRLLFLSPPLQNSPMQRCLQIGQRTITVILKQPYAF